MFLLNENQIIQENFLEEINNLLNSGNATNIMAQEDWEEIFNDLRQILKEKNIEESKDNMLKVM